MNKIAVIEYLKICSEAAKKFTNRLVGKLAQTVTKAMEELESVKADKPSVVSFTIPTNGWSSDSNASYPKYYDIAVTGVTAKDRAEITIAPGSLDTAKACGLCPTNETLTNKIRVRSASVPTATIAAEYWIENGKE